MTTEGKPRNPLAFTPFLGGKRICIGKTFAEVAIRYTIPIIFAHFDFEFVNPEVQSAHKNTYSIGGLEDFKMPVKVIIKNKIAV